MNVALRTVPGRYAVARLSAGVGLPEWAVDSGELLSVTRTRDETSILCEERLVPRGVRCERGFSAFAVRGPIPFSATGVIASIARPLAEAGISLFAVATFDTDYLLVRDTDVARAADAWAAAGVAVDETTR